MRELKDRFQRKALLRGFLNKSIFNGGEVNYLTILQDGKFHVYWSKDVITAMADRFEVVNSTGRTSGEYDAQKVLFRHNGFNVGELEMRNDSENHYGEVRFNMNKDSVLSLLADCDFESADYNDMVVMYGHSLENLWKMVGSQVYNSQGNPPQGRPACP